jgi:hypothetical protein
MIPTPRDTVLGPSAAAVKRSQGGVSRRASFGRRGVVDGPQQPVRGRVVVMLVLALAGNEAHMTLDQLHAIARAVEPAGG